MPDPIRSSAAFQVFQESFFGPWTESVFRDQIHILSLQQLSAEERKQAEELLLQHLEQGSTDSRIVDGLGELRSQRAMPFLEQRLQASRGDQRVIALALALWKIAHSPKAVLALIEVLTSFPNFMVKVFAAMSLQNCRCQQAAQALQKALSDDHPLVRYNAATSLLVMYQLWQDAPMDPGHPLALEIQAANDVRKRETTIAQILALIGDRTLPKCEDVAKENN